MSDWPWALAFQVAFDVNPGDEPEPGDWTDLSARLSSVDGGTVSVQHSTLDDNADTTLTLNNRDRSLDPTNPAATHNLVPMRHARLRCTVAATTFDLFRGYVEDWAPMWPEFNQGLVDVTLLDASAWLALDDQDVNLPRQRTGERVAAVLDLAGWPVARRSLDTGHVMVDALEETQVNLLNLLSDCHEAEGGLLYVSPSGDVVFRDRHHDLDAEPAVALGASGYGVNSVSPRWGAADLVNTGRVELADGDVVEFADDASRDAYGVRPWTVRDLPISDVESEALAMWQVFRFAQPNLELEGVGVPAHADGAAALPDLLGVGVGDLADFDHTPPGGGTAVMVGSIRRWSITFGSGFVQWAADLASHHGDGPWVRFDDATTGFDVGRFAP